MDRNTQADDNAEHLYRWIKNNHSEKEIYFVLDRKSHDWKRLSEEGFNLLAYGSKEHEKKLLKCSKIISSHIDEYVVNYFKNNLLEHSHIVFLQHGVTKDNISHWLNGKKRIDLVVTCSKEEFFAFVENYGKYNLTDKEVKLLGFPRHDALLSKELSPSINDTKIIVIMPTWRLYLSGKQVFGNAREDNPYFMNSTYAKTWYALLKSKKFFELAEQHSCSIIFYPHANVQQYIKYFDIPEYIKVFHNYDGSIQKIFKDASVMITDYSSVAFEMAYLKKPIIYYQFDQDEFFNGEHVYQKGFFDYNLHGFGAVVQNENELCKELDIIIRDRFIPSDKYMKRMEYFFAYHDGKSCERVYNAICGLDITPTSGL